MTGPFRAIGCSIEITGGLVKPHVQHLRPINFGNLTTEYTARGVDSVLKTTRKAWKQEISSREVGKMFHQGGEGDTSISSFH